MSCDTSDKFYRASSVLSRSMAMWRPTEEIISDDKANRNAGRRDIACKKFSRDLSNFILLDFL